MNWYKIAQENEDIQSVASKLNFKPVKKNATVYFFCEFILLQRY